MPTTRGSSSCGPGGPLFQPERQQPVRWRIDLHLLAAAMCHGQRRLEQEQALLGRKRRDPPSLGALDDRGEIDVGLEAQERELEPPLAVLPAVASTLVAAELGQKRYDAVSEADHLRPGRARRLDLGRIRSTRRFNTKQSERHRPPGQNRQANRWRPRNQPSLEN